MKKETKQVPSIGANTNNELTRRRGFQATMSDVAKQAGVSLMTVSRALNQPSRVSAGTRTRVEAAVNLVGYVQNRIASSLSSQRSTVVGLILPNIAYSLFADTMKGISEVLHDNDYHLMISESGNDEDHEEVLISAFLSQRVSGLILHGTTHTPRAIDLIQKSGLPVVENGNLTDHPIDSVVSYSNFRASKAMTMNLHRLGYKKVAFVSLPTANNEIALQRRNGFLAALSDLGITPDPRLILERPRGIVSGAETIVRLMERAPDLDAIFFTGDAQVIGAVLEAQRRGWAIPERVGLASFDDSDILSNLTPSVTTIRLPRYQIGRRTAECLVERISGHAHSGVCVDLKYEIVQREST